MAKRTRNQSTGDIGEVSLQWLFTACGYACSKIDPDFGEDFFVFCQDGEYIEPFRIFVQAKASEHLDTQPSDWTEYCDPMTVRNWVLNQELTVVVRQNLVSKEMRYCIPEEDIDYWTLDVSADVPVRLSLPFGYETVAHLVWRARLRHYDRIVRLVRPNVFEPESGNDVPAYRKFVVELLMRLGVLDAAGDLPAEAMDSYSMNYMTVALGTDLCATDDMSLHEIVRYSACLRLALDAVRAAAGDGNGLSKVLLDDCACVLALCVQAQEEAGTALQPRPDATLQAIRAGLLRQASLHRAGEPLLTEWIDGALSPIRPGVYQRDDGELGFSLWDGAMWQGWALRFDEGWDGVPPTAAAVRQDLPWRGAAALTPTLQVCIAGSLAASMAGSADTESAC